MKRAERIQAMKEWAISFAISWVEFSQCLCWSVWNVTDITAIGRRVDTMKKFFR